MAEPTSDDSSDSLKRTCLFEKHAEAGGKFVPFGGWEMPVLYTGVIDEHLTVRSAVGLFDVSHMGEISLKGPDAEAFLQEVTSNDISKLFPGRAQYSLLLNERGGVVDDIVVYMLRPQEYFLCVNASNTDKDFAWLQSKNHHAIELVNESARFAQIAIQGPKARELVISLLGVTDGSYAEDAFLPFYIKEAKLPLLGKSDTPLLVACTGYTGEDGFEIFCPTEAGPALWDTLLQLGAGLGVKPIGLGARDTLRLEVCYPLHGHELSDDLPALSCGVGWVIKFDKGDFIGKDALLKAKAAGLKHTIVGLEVKDRGIIRAETKIFHQGKEVGWVASGTHTPTLGKAVGLGFVPPELAKAGTELQADVRGRMLETVVVPRPFHRKNK